MKHETVREAALNYAEALVRFHELDRHVRLAGANALREDLSALRVARDEMYDAQNELNRAAEVVVELGLTA